MKKKIVLIALIVVTMLCFMGSSFSSNTVQACGIPVPGAQLPEPIDC